LDKGSQVVKSVFIPSVYEKRKTFYKAEREPGHITFLFCVSLSGKKLPPLVIITGKSYDSDLEQFGIGTIDTGTTAHIVHTKTGYINNKVLKEYIKKVAIPYWEKTLNLKDNKLFLIQDNMSAHVDGGVQTLLKQHNIEPFELVPHSSHLLQPLDQGTFSQWKALMKKVYETDMQLTKRSFRIYNGLRCFEKVSGFFDIMQSFRHCGFFLNLVKTPPVSFNLNKILEKPSAPPMPPTAIKPIKIKIPIKRIRVHHKEEKNPQNTTCQLCSLMKYPPTKTPQLMPMAV